MADNDSEHSPVPSASHCQLSLHSSTSTSDASCDHCGQWDTSGSTPLKRCKGCAVVLYCDKDCQRAAWPEHKVFCQANLKSATSTSIARDAEELGYATPLSLIHAVREWRQIHSYTLDALTHLALYTNGGVEHNLATPHAMVFILQSVANHSDYNGHVSTAFRILSARVAHRDDLSCLKGHWTEDRIEKRRQSLALLRESTPDSDTALAGLLPLTFMVLGTGAVCYHFTDVNRPLRHPPDASPDPLTFLAFSDLDLLCRRAISLGIAFEGPGDATQIYPKASVYSHVSRSRDRKKWKKISKPTVWRDVLEPMRDESPSEFFSEMPLKLIWELFENW